MPATISLLLPRTRDIFHGLPNPYDLAEGKKYQIMDNHIAVFYYKNLLYKLVGRWQSRLYDNGHLNFFRSKCNSARLRPPRLFQKLKIMTYERRGTILFKNYSKFWMWWHVNENEILVNLCSNYFQNSSFFLHFNFCLTREESLKTNGYT